MTMHYSERDLRILNERFPQKEEPACETWAQFFKQIDPMERTNIILGGLTGIFAAGLVVMTIVLLV